MIPEDKVEEIRLATDIVNLISDYVTLKKRGRNFMGLCPFHSEKTPSFSVNPEKQIFHCFGCHAGGNAISFLMRLEGVGFVEAMKFLAQRAGIELEIEKRDESKAKENEALFSINEYAAAYFQNCLFSDAGSKALTYLQQRGFSRADIERFGLGYAPSGWRNLLDTALNDSHSAELLVKAGLVLEKDSGDLYDRFRDRVIFPIVNLSGKVVAFGGRILSAEAKAPKYLNTPETAVYVKGSILYGLFQNKESIRTQGAALLVEGYMDLLSLACNGVDNVVASSGTALTEQQARLVLRYTRRAVLMYDSDVAGQAATLRGADILLENGLDVAVAELPSGHDPDSYVREKGTEAVNSLIKGATPIFDFRLDRILSKPAESRNAGIHEILESLSRIPDRIERGLLMQRLAERTRIGEKLLWTELEAILRQRQKRNRAQSEIANRLQDLGDVSKHSRFDKAVEDLIRIITYDWEQAQFVFEYFDIEFVRESKYYPVLAFLKNHLKGGKKPSEDSLLQTFSDSDLSAFLSQVTHEELDEIDMRRWAMDCMRSVKRQVIQQQIDEIRETIRLNQEQNEQVTDLLRKCVELENLKASLQDPNAL